ncbi:hypothetical protein DFH08DRAFT_817714 [Mycena albidolilacea]|uniref:Uncharacterized protein n=1 Tax=Mycena albidolilacea TaxID=1033008 RepID=A0AAD6ZIH5_9AGAR|nr:hypothetical protein DFH08DRAFT_817714 [Mycena albidolilacea]
MCAPYSPRSFKDLTDGRPKAVEHWIVRASKWEKTVDIGVLGDAKKLGSFVASWWDWWVKVGPGPGAEAPWEKRPPSDDGVAALVGKKSESKGNDRLRERRGRLQIRKERPRGGQNKDGAEECEIGMRITTESREIDIDIDIEPGPDNEKGHVEEWRWGMGMGLGLIGWSARGRAMGIGIDRRGRNQVGLGKHEQPERQILATIGELDYWSYGRNR